MLKKLLKKTTGKKATSTTKKKPEKIKAKKISSKKIIPDKKPIPVEKIETLETTRVLTAEGWKRKNTKKK
jgi:hypothetical protein